VKGASTSQQKPAAATAGAVTPPASGEGEKTKKPEEQKPAKSTIWTEDEAKSAIRKFDVIIDMANAAGANISGAKKSLLEAVDAFGKGNMNDVFCRIVETREQLNENVRKMNYLEQKFKFVWPMYGFWPLLDATSFLFLYAFLLPSHHHYAEIITGLLNIKPQGFGVPMWTVLFAGIGACVQIMVNVTNDIKTNGYVERVRRLWYYLLPIVGPVFGFIAYVLVSLGFLSLSGITAEQLTKTTFSTIVVCFLSGYSTEWFIGELGKLASKTGESKGGSR
jgi:hypothetical protein